VVPFDDLIKTLALILVFLAGGSYFMYHFRTLFAKRIRNEWLRQNIAVVLMLECFFWAYFVAVPDFKELASIHGYTLVILLQSLFFLIISFVTNNFLCKIQETEFYKKISFGSKHVILILTIISSISILSLLINFVSNGFQLLSFQYSLTSSIFMGALVSFAYLFGTFTEIVKRQRLQEKELEISRMSQLKTRAELDALHSKINPHFLYNALNSIADLTITDGHTARRMTLSLSDLFRYSINYSGSNYSTVANEITMVESYLEIEKIRFEEKLSYEFNVQPCTEMFLLPRFLLQPLVENAVKHGLKGSAGAGKIKVCVRKENEKLQLSIYDNGTAFPENFSGGYGLKSVMDKLRLLFPGKHELAFVNKPEKHIAITIKKLLEHEPGLESIGS
jgi:two-component system LytT family sensor kinase